MTTKDYKSLSDVDRAIAIAADKAANAENGIAVHSTGRVMMTREAADKAAMIFHGIGGFSRVNIDEFGWNSGCFSVELWSVNARAGNRNLTSVDHLPTEKEAKLIAKKAKGKANDRDREALARIAAEREVNRE